jgi:hypothetical protein
VGVNSSEDARHCSTPIYVNTLWSKPKRFRQEKLENLTRVESHLSFSLETGASVCLLSTTAGGAPPYLRKHHVIGHILTRNQAVSRGSVWFVPQVTVAEFNVQGGCDKSGI